MSSNNNPKQAIIEAANAGHINQTSSQALLANLNANTLPSTIGTQVELLETTTPLVLNIVVDSTGSLDGYEDVIIEGINDCVGDFKMMRNKTGQEMFLAVHEFSNRSGSPHGLRTIQDFIHIQDFVELNRNDYNTDGMTPLYDAVYDGITQTMAFATATFTFGATGVQEITLIITDGNDNESVHNAEQVAAFLKEFNSKQHFVAALIGVGNYPYMKIAKDMGFLDGNIMAVDKTKDGIAKVLKLYSSSVGARSQNSMAGKAVSSGNFFVNTP